jgi:hypothetical protein
VLPRDILRRFTCRYNGETVFSAELFPAIAANPYLVSTLLATESGTLEFEWQGDNGFAQVERRSCRSRERAARPLASRLRALLLRLRHRAGGGHAALRLRRHGRRHPGHAARRRMNPAMLWVQEGEQLWRRRPARVALLRRCHGEAAMRGVAARYPAWDEALRGR